MAGNANGNSNGDKNNNGMEMEKPNFNLQQFKTIRGQKRNNNNERTYPFKVAKFNPEMSDSDNESDLDDFYEKKECGDRKSSDNEHEETDEDSTVEEVLTLSKEEIQNFHAVLKRWKTQSLRDEVPPNKVQSK